MNLSLDGQWPYLSVLIRIGLALGTGLFVGLERERRGKEAGMRTFAFTALLGCLGGLMGAGFALMCLALIGVLVVFLNWQRLVTNKTAELTTSVALLVTGVMGIMCGLGHTFTPVAIGVITAALLAWKEKMTHFSVGLSETELRSAILLFLISFVVYPVLPTHPLDRWGLIEPRGTWMTVILIASLGFVNYLLLKIYGSRGALIAGFLGGLVNSTVAVTELSNRVKQVGVSLNDTAYQGVLLATVAMLLRNGILLGILSLRALVATALPLLLMLIGCAALAFRRHSKPANDDDEHSDGTPESAPASLALESPFSLQSALKFGVIFLALHIAGTLAQRFVGNAGFYAVSAVGGLVSSASSVASAATLCMKGQISPSVAANGAILASLTSALVNLPLIYRIAAQKPLSARLTRALSVVVLLGLLGIGAQHACGQFLKERYQGISATIERDTTPPIQARVSL